MKEIAWQDRVLGHLIATRAREYGDRTFLFFRDREISYRELDVRSNAVASHLLRLGLKAGDKVAIMLPNCPEFLYLWFGLAKVGAIEVPVNTAHRGELLGYMLNHSDSRWLVIADSFLSRLEEIPDPLRKLERVFVYSENGRVPGANLSQPIQPFAELLEGNTGSPQVSVKPSDIFCIQYTSGTTGPSKGVMLPHSFAFAFVAMHQQVCGYTPDSILYTCLPLFHGNAQVLTTAVALASGARLALAEQFHATTFWDELRHYGATAFNYIGGMLTMLYKQPESPRDRDHQVKIAFGAGAPQNLWAAFEERFGLQFVEGFGLTESGVLTCNYGPERKVGSIGRKTGLYDVKIFDDDDHEIGPNQIGEIVSRPVAAYQMMSGYYKMPEKTHEAFRNLWFHTGDYGYCDESGYFFFVDRKKDAIRRRGENISSFEVEKIINAHPKVLESVALAYPSEVGEDDVRVIVVLKPDQTLSPDQVLAWCEPRMAYFMLPRYVEFRTDLPKTPTNRVEKYKLRTEGLGPGAWDREKAGYQVKK